VQTPCAHMPWPHSVGICFSLPDSTRGGGDFDWNGWSNRLGTEKGNVLRPCYGWRRAPAVATLRLRFGVWVRYCRMVNEKDALGGVAVESSYFLALRLPATANGPLYQTGGLQEGTRSVSAHNMDRAVWCPGNLDRPRFPTCHHLSILERTTISDPTACNVSEAPAFASDSHSTKSLLHILILLQTSGRHSRGPVPNHGSTTGHTNCVTTLPPPSPMVMLKS
jgi:hypothetical protein